MSSNSIAGGEIPFRRDLCMRCLHAHAKFCNTILPILRKYLKKLGGAGVINPNPASYTMIFDQWLEACSSDNDVQSSMNDGSGGGSNGDDAIAMRLRKEARSHFESLPSSASKKSSSTTTKDSSSSSATLPATASSSSSSSKASTIEQDLAKASSGTPNGALALLVSTLGPALAENPTPVVKVRALHCLMGALEGSADLTHGVRQAVGRFLVELCRPVGCVVQPDNTAVDSVDLLDHEMKYVDAADLTSEQVTQKLQSMSSYKHSSPESTTSHHNEHVRDAAITCLTALLQSNLELFPTQQSQQTSSSSSSSSDSFTKQQQSSSSTPVMKAMGVIYQSMELRIELAILGVRYRCQVSTTSGDNNNNGIGLPNIDDGMSHLPRVKRSQCFNLFNAALDGLCDDEKKRINLQSSSPITTSTTSPIPPSLLRQMSTYVSLTSSCMCGETDPRCLVQLLTLFNMMQRIMLPIFASSNNSTDDDVRFPFLELFDAVAPYYPIHFTPPKNDPHGITQVILQDALLNVLCEAGAKYNSQMLHKSKDQEEETMIMHTARMFLDRLDPPKSSNYDPPSNGSNSDDEDKLDAVKDITFLFLPLLSITNENVEKMDTTHDDSQMYSPNVTRVPLDFLSELSSAMARVHEEAVSSDTKSLASAIRKFSSCFAKSLEPVMTMESTSVGLITLPLWEAYVVNSLRHLSPILESAPQGLNGRATTAYFASLAADGGLMTLRIVLEECFPRLLGVLSMLDDKENTLNTGDTVVPNLSKRNSRDEEKLSSAMRGIAALISSCRVALQKWHREDSSRVQQVLPHPLSAYAATTVRKIGLVLIDVSEPGSLALAACGALESVLTCYDLSLLEEDDMVPLEESISLIFRTVSDEASGMKSTKMHEWKLACSRALGAVLSVGFCQDKDDGGGVKASERIGKLASNLLPQILASATSTRRGSSPKMHTIRYDWVVLAGACANGSLGVSEQIVSDLLSRMVTALRINEQNQKTAAMALSYITCHGGPNVGIAFHVLSTPFDVIKELCHQKDTGPGRQLQRGVSSLQLPVSRTKDKEVASKTIMRAQSILPLLIPAYECPSSVASCDSLTSFVTNILPPLSDDDEVSLYVSLPLLAAVLKRSNKDLNMLEEGTSTILMSMVEDLALFSIRSDHHAHTRSAAASCLFSILFQSSEDNETKCARLIEKLMKEVISPALTTALIRLGKEFSETSKGDNKVQASVFSQVEDTLSFMSVLGAAAACKGGTFSQMGDKIVLFLIELACRGSSRSPSSDATAMDLTMPSEQGQKHPLLNPASHVFILPASAFGSVLSVHNGGAFWRQRLTHKTLPILLGALSSQAESQNPPAFGTLCVVCHMLCCLPTSLVGEANVKQMLPTVVAGLVYFSKNSSAMAQSEMISSKPASLLSIILAALVKVLTVSREDVTKFVGIIIPSLLLLGSSTIESSEGCIPRHLLVFQCLETVAAHPHARNSVLREKDQVVSVLSTVVDHPSSVIRNAVVQARNVWCTLT